MQKLRKVNNEEDFTLIQLASNGNQKAFTTLCANNTSLIKSTIKRMVTGTKLEKYEDDLVQAVYIKMWTNLAKLKNVSIKGWISSISKNVVIDEIRKANKVNVISISNTNNQINEDENVELEFFIRDEGMTPDEEMENNEMVNKIVGIINGPEISDVQRKVLHMRFIEDMKYERIATKLGMNLETVKGIIFRTRKTLQEKIKAS